MTSRTGPRARAPEEARVGSGGRSGFTLIEMMAVIVIMGLVFAIGVPRLGTSKQRLLRAEAEAIAASLDFARQRAVMTATPHRLLIDLEEGGYRVEWWVTEELDEAEPDFLPEDPEDAVELISLRPPARAEREYVPVPHPKLGAFTWLDDALYFVGLDSPSGWIEGGDVAIVFRADGTTDFALLEIADSDDNHMTLEIEPILNRVGRRSGRARS